MEGDLMGKEGIVKAVLDDLNLTVVETNKELAQPLVISKGQQTDQHADVGKIVSFLLFFPSPMYLLLIGRHSMSLH
jgi:hypothetical protein